MIIENIEPQKYKETLVYLMKVLHIVTDREHRYGLKDKKIIAQLRVAERSFNFLLDQFPLDKVSTVFGMEEWNKIKEDRDVLAARLAGYIKIDPGAQKRYEFYCDNLKDTTALGAML